MKKGGGVTKNKIQILPNHKYIIILESIVPTKQPCKDDWSKLRHGVMYLKLNGTLYIQQWLSIDNLSNIMWWLDGSFKAHCDSKGHTGAMMSMRKCAIINIAGKRKINVASST